MICKYYCANWTRVLTFIVSIFPWFLEKRLCVFTFHYCLWQSCSPPSVYIEKFCRFLRLASPSKKKVLWSLFGFLLEHISSLSPNLTLEFHNFQNSHLKINSTSMSGRNKTPALLKDVVRMTRNIYLGHCLSKIGVSAFVITHKFSDSVSIRTGYVLPLVTLNKMEKVLTV